MKTSSLPFLNRSFRGVALMAGALAFAPGLAMGIDVVNEDFSDFAGGPTANGWYFYNSVPIGAGWTVSTDSVNPVHMSGNKLANPAGNTTNSVLLHQFSDVTLSNVGDTVTFQFDLRLRSGSTAGVLEAGLWNLDTTLTGNIAGGTDPMAGGTGDLFQQAFNSTSAVYKNGEGTTLGSSFTSASIGDFNEHRLILELTMASDGLAISSSMDGITLSSYTDTSVTGDFTVNTLSIASYSIAQAFFIDNVIVGTNVPEPASSALFLGLGLMVALVYLRRR